jgi:hypothetical protein
MFLIREIENEDSGLVGACGWCFWLIIALNMDTSVESSPGVRVMNFSLIAQQQNQLLLGALISLRD